MQMETRKRREGKERLEEREREKFGMEVMGIIQEKKRKEKKRKEMDGEIERTRFGRGDWGMDRRRRGREPGTGPRRAIGSATATATRRAGASVAEYHGAQVSMMRREKREIKEAI